LYKKIHFLAKKCIDINAKLIYCKYVDSSYLGDYLVDLKLIGG